MSKSIIRENFEPDELSNRAGPSDQRKQTGGLEPEIVYSDYERAGRTFYGAGLNK